MAVNSATDAGNAALEAYLKKQDAALSAQSAQSEADGKLTQDYNTFITLLTTQLQNQDPLQPMDSSQFTQQLVQFSAVEQQITANKKLDQLISLQQTNGGVTMLGFIGKEVEVGSDKLVHETGKTSEFAYALDDVTSDVTITIKDKDGQVVRTMTSQSGTIGRHEITWDGKNDGGTVLPSGTYTIAVTGKDSTGQDAAIGLSVYGLVDGVEATSTGAVLSVGDQQVDVNKILSIRDRRSAVVA